MLLIPCPWCGDRSESEFHCGGELKAPRPEDPAAMSVADWTGYLTLRDNPRGPMTEVWWHARGCGAWFALRRDTATHEILPDPEGGGA